MIRLLGFTCLNLLAGLWLSLKLTQCQNLPRGVITMPSLCYNTSSGKICFTTFLVNINHSVRKPFNIANDWCRKFVPGSSLIISNSIESQRTVDKFIGRLSLVNEIIFTDARKLSVSESLRWSWANGQRTSLNVTITGDMSSDGGCLALNRDQPLHYCSDNVSSQRRYICEYSDFRSDVRSYQYNNKSYVVSKEVATWYDARNECLRLNGDLAFITDLQTIWNWSWLKDKGKQRYWIGLHRNKWIWNSSDFALTYSNFEDGYPDDSPNQQCVCIYPRCRSGSGGIVCNYERKWSTCNCNNSYAIVCQKESFNVTSEEMFSATLTDSKSSAILPLHTSAGFPDNYSFSSPSSASAVASITRSATIADSSSLMTQKPSDRSFAETATASVSPSLGIPGILLTICLPVTAIFIIVAVTLVVRKRKHDNRNEGSLTKQTDQSETVATVYATVVPVNRPSEGSLVSPNNTIYADVEMIQRPTPTCTNNAIYATVQPTGESVHMGGNLVYADLDLQKKTQQ